jgi:glycine cleavage system H lipoate-binding protein
MYVKCVTSLILSFSDFSSHKISNTFTFLLNLQNLHTEPFTTRAIDATNKRPRAMSPLQLSSQKLFLPSRHMWLRIIEAPLSSHLSKMPWMIDVGLTERGLDDIGDITSIQISSQFKMPSHESLKSPNNGNKNNPIPVPVPVSYGQDIVKLNWDGHLITKADELYHTIWETISETTSVVAPVDGEVCEIHCKEDDQWVDSDTALLTMSTDGDLIEMRKDEWMHAEEYEEYVYAMEKGKFFDSDLEA